ncbi:MAG: tetratricopeptide repeat protein [Bacteroidota bacterium]
MKPAPIILLALTLIAGCRKEHQLSSDSPQAIEAYKRGVTQYEQFNFSEAKTSFESAITSDSLFAMAWLRLAVVQLSIRDEPQADSCVQRAMDLASRASQREQLFIRMWYYRMHYNARAAASTADSLIAFYPDEKEAYLFRGNLYEQAKNFDAAIRSYQRAVQADTGYALAVMTLGYAYSNIGDLDKSIFEMQRYIQLAPKEPDPLASYADILMRAGRYDEALEQYRKSLVIKPDYWYSIREIGNIYAIKGRLKEAEEQFHQSFRYLPHNRQLEATEASVEGRLALLRGNPGDAATLFEKSLSIDTMNIDAAYGLVQALARSNQIQEAQRVLERIRFEFERRELLSSPAMAGFFLASSIVKMHAGDLVQALVLCDSGFAYSTTQARAAIYRQMAEVNLRQRAFDDGLSACEEALASSPNSPDILLTLERIYAANGDRRMGAEIGGRLLEFWKNADPDFAPRKEVLRLVKHQPS